MKKLKTVWVIVYIGRNGEFPTQDIRPVWSTRTAAINALEQVKGESGREEYKVVKFSAKGTP